MYGYKVYDFDYDDTTSFVLYHEKKFTKDEYEKIVNNCLKIVLGRMKRNKKIIDKSDNISEDQFDKLDKKLNLSNLNGEWHIYANIYKVMIEKYGFKELNIEYTFTLRDGFYGKGQKIVNKVID
jgi:hypothetical protein